MGHLIATMATARASALAPSTLYSALQRAAPVLARSQPKRTWLREINRVLATGATRGVFGCVGANGEAVADAASDAATKPTGRGGRKSSATALAGGRHVERMWFYKPDGDWDRERAEVAKATMPERRSESRKFKRYYWKPLDKISKWDREDEL
jgi:hypothetical protein